MRFAKLKALYTKPEMKASLLTFSIFAVIIIFVVLAYNFPIGTIAVMVCTILFLMVSLVWIAIYDTIKKSLH